MFADIVDLLKFVYCSDLFFDLFSMVCGMGIIFLTLCLIRRF